MKTTKNSQKGSISKGLLILFGIAIIGGVILWSYMYQYTHKRPSEIENEVKALLAKDNCKMIGYISKESITAKERFRYQCDSGMIYEVPLKYPDDEQAFSTKQLGNEKCEIVETIISDNLLSKRYRYRYQCESGMSFTVFS